jgi:hypothetical protein
MFQTAFSLAQQRNAHLHRLSSGIPLIDELLEGGFERGYCYLLYGSPQCTQLLGQSIAHALRHFAPDAGVVVIDANNGIRPDRILDSLRATDLPHPPQTYLNHLHIARAFTVDQLYNLLLQAPEHLQKVRGKVLFVNGITHLLEEEETAQSPSVLHQPNAPVSPLSFRRAQFAAQLNRLAFQHQIVVTASADSSSRSNRPPLRIGQAAHHSFHVLLQHTQQGSIDIFTLQKHPRLPWRRRSTVTLENQLTLEHPPRSARQTQLFPEEYLEE